MSHENLAPAVLASLARQLKTLATKPPEGIKYMPSDGNITVSVRLSLPGGFTFCLCMLSACFCPCAMPARRSLPSSVCYACVYHCASQEILAEIEGPEGTPYMGGSFRVKLVLGKEYPATPPKGYFLTKIFHPNVSPTGDICVNTLKRDWKPDVGLAHVLQVIRCLLIVPFPESSLNDDAGKMFMESYDEYARHARLMTRCDLSPRVVDTPFPRIPRCIYCVSAAFTRCPSFRWPRPARTQRMMQRCPPVAPARLVLVQRTAMVRL